MNISNDTCARCSGALVSATEISSGVCIPCTREIHLESIQLKLEIEKLQSELSRSRESIGRLVEAIEKIKETSDSRKMGEEAAVRGIDGSDNPFPAGHRREAWDDGFVIGLLGSQIKESCAVGVWARDSLILIEELARGYGQEEIGQKISTVVEKLSDFFAGG